MISSTAATVRFVLATHKQMDLHSIRDDQRLIRDLDVTPLDLVWIAMRVEALETSSGEFPIDSLREVETVGDLIAAFEAWRTMDLCAE